MIREEEQAGSGCVHGAPRHSRPAELPPPQHLEGSGHWQRLGSAESGEPLLHRWRWWRMYGEPKKLHPCGTQTRTLWSVSPLPGTAWLWAPLLPLKRLCSIQVHFPSPAKALSHLCRRQGEGASVAGTRTG